MTSFSIEAFEVRRGALTTSFASGVIMRAIVLRFQRIIESIGIESISGKIVDSSKSRVCSVSMTGDKRYAFS